jgi:hypothetical protein
MKNILTDTTSGRATMTAALTLTLFLVLAGPTFAQTRTLNVIPAGAASSHSAQMPQGVKVLAQLPLDGQPVTRMYTQWESGRTYLYIEHGGESRTAVDVTKKRNPQIVSHQPAKLETARVQSAEGGPIEVSWPNVIAEFDNVGGRGMLGALQSDSPDDAQLLQAFGRDSSTLVDRDRNLVFFASSTRLLIVEDGRWKGMDYTIN